MFFSRVPSVSEDVARDALLKFVESKWNYSSKPARNLTFKDLQPITVYRVGVIPVALCFPKLTHTNMTSARKLLMIFTSLIKTV